MIAGQSGVAHRLERPGLFHTYRVPLGCQARTPLVVDWRHADFATTILPSAWVGLRKAAQKAASVRCFLPKTRHFIGAAWLCGPFEALLPCRIDPVEPDTRQHYRSLLRNPPGASYLMVPAHALRSALSDGATPAGGARPRLTTGTRHAILAPTATTETGRAACAPKRASGWCDGAATSVGRSLPSRHPNHRPPFASRGPSG